MVPVTVVRVASVEVDAGAAVVDKVDEDIHEVVVVTMQRL